MQHPEQIGTRRALLNNLEKREKGALMTAVVVLELFLIRLQCLIDLSDGKSNGTGH